MPNSRVRASINGRQIKNPAVRAMLAVLGVMVAIGLIGLVMAVALPLAALAIGVAIVGSLTAAFIPRLRRRKRETEEQLPRTSPRERVPRRGSVSKRIKRVEPLEPPRTVDKE